MEKQRVAIQDYVFEYKNKDLNKASLEYEFKETVSIPSGVSRNDLIISLFAYDKEEEYELILSLSYSSSELKILDNKYLIINNKVNYIDLYEPDINRIPTLDLESDQDTFSNPSHVWIKKETDNEYFIKISIPSELLFVVFKLKIS